MTRFILGADRDQLYLALDVDGRRSEARHRAPVLERSDHRLVSDFLEGQQCDVSTIDAFTLLAVSHSKTTVRVNATLLASIAWYYDRPLTITAVDSLDDPVIADTMPDYKTAFNPAVLAQLN